MATELRVLGLRGVGANADSGPFRSWVEQNRGAQQPCGKLAGFPPPPCMIITSLSFPHCCGLITRTLHLGLPEPLLFV